MNIRYPLFWPTYNGKTIIKALKKIFPKDGSNRWIGQGPTVDLFEEEFGKKFGFKYPVMTNSGTGALHMAYVLAGIKKGDEVIVPCLNCTADLHPLKWMEAKIVFADLQPNTLNIDPEDIKRKITEKTKAIIALHFGGLTCDIDRIIKIARKYKIKVIEDACQALGARNIGKADYTCISLQAIKNLTVGDGGMLIVKTKEDYKRAKKLRWFSIDREQKIFKKWQAWDKRGITFDQKEPGFKYQATDIDAAIGLAQLKDFDENLQKRKNLTALYRLYLTGLPGIELLDNGDNACWLFMIRVKDRDRFCQRLLDHGIETNVTHTRNDLFDLFGGKRRKDLPNMDKVEFEYICLPLHLRLKEKDIVYICEIIKEIQYGYL